MAVAETAKLIVDLSLQGNFQRQLTGAQRSFNSLGKTITNTQGRAYKAGQQIGTGIKRGALIAVSAITALTGYLAYAVKQGQEAANVQKVYARAIANSGKVSAEYVAALNAQQTALMNLAGVDDELIKSEQTRLIQMGLSGKATLKLTPLILDAAKATGKDLLTVTIAAGKAANGNATALQRLGIMVDKTRFKVDPLAETIRVLNQRFGGTTQALSGSLDTRLGALRENLANIAEDAGQKLLPALTRIVDVVGTKVVPAFGKFIDRILPEVIKGVDKFASLLENGGAERGINAITDALVPLVQLVKIAAAPVKAIVGAFLSLPKEVQTVLIGAFAVNKLTGGLVTNIAGGIVEQLGKGLLGAFAQRGGSPANPVFVSDVGGGVGGKALSALPTAIGGAVSGLTASVLGVVLPIAIGTALGEISRQAFAAMPSHQRQIDLRQQTAATGRRQGFGLGTTQPTTGGKREDRTYDAIERLRTTQAPAFKSLAGKIQDDKVTTVNALNRGFASTGRQIDDKIAPRINPKLTDLDRSTDTAGQAVVRAVNAKDFSFDQRLVFNFTVPGAGTQTRTVTLQNRYGPANGSAGDDFRSGKPLGGL